MISYQKTGSVALWHSPQMKQNIRIRALSVSGCERQPCLSLVWLLCTLWPSPHNSEVLSILRFHFPAWLTFAVSAYTNISRCSRMRACVCVIRSSDLFVFTGCVSHFRPQWGTGKWLCHDQMVIFSWEHVGEESGRRGFCCKTTRLTDKVFPLMQTSKYI